VIALAGAALAGPDDLLKGIVLEVKGRSIPENSIELATPTIVPMILVGMGAGRRARRA